VRIAEVVVERAVLLHQHDDVLDGVEADAAHRLGHRRVQGRGSSEQARAAPETPSETVRAWLQTLVRPGERDKDR